MDTITKIKLDYGAIQFTAPYSYKVRDDRIRLIRTLQVEIDKQCDDSNVLVSILSYIRSHPEQYVAYSRHDSSKVSYAQVPEHIYDVNKRVKTTFQRYVRRQCGIGSDQLRDNRLDDLSSRLFPLSFAGLRIVTGQAIVDAYAQSVGFQSCMCSENAKYTELYAINPERVSMVIYGQRDARAMLFKCDDGTIVMDRVYPNNSRWGVVMRTWARKRKYVYRTNDGACDCPLSDRSEHYVTLRCDKYFPYSDTFRYAKDVDEHTIICSNRQSFGNFQLMSQNGGTEGGRHRGDNRIHCISCGSILDEDDTYNYNDDTYCENCFHEEFTYCEHHGGDVPNDDIHEVNGEYLCEQCRNEIASECYSCNHWFRNEDTVSVDDGEYTYCHECAEQQCSQCESCESMYRNRDGVRTHDDTFYCQGCADNELSECAECSNTFPNDDCVRIGEDKVYCESCAEDECSRCEGCGDMFVNDDGVKTKDDEFYCESCADSENLAECDICELWANRDSGKERMPDGAFLCDDCATKELVKCFHCGTMWKASDTKVTKDTATIYCYSCVDKLIADGKLGKCDVCNEYYTKEYEHETQKKETAVEGSHVCGNVVEVTIS